MSVEPSETPGTSSSFQPEGFGLKNIEFSEDAKPEALWKTWDQKAVKKGPHHTIYWVKHASTPDAQSRRQKEFKSSSISQSYKVDKKYTGDWEGNKKNGFGSQVWATGSKYEGEWKNNKRHGKGTFWISLGGNLRKQYTGDWISDKRHGEGSFFYEDGDRYEGQWSSNNRHGRGKMTYADGSVYEGEWQDNQRSGLGVFSLTNGNRYEGHWLNDVKEGPGRFFYSSTGKVYEGEWHKDIPKCGEFKSLDTINEGGIDHFNLPQLGLLNPDSVLGESIAKIRQERMLALSAFDNENTNSMEDRLHVFTDNEICQIRQLFEEIDYEHLGLIKCKDIVSIMAALGICPEEEDVSDLLSELNATYDTKISFAELIDVMALLL